MSFTRLEVVNYVLVRLLTDTGIEGLGEASALGGPTWSGESAESIQATVERYLKPVLLGQEATTVERLLRLMGTAVQDNLFAKAAVEMALLDAVGKFHGLPVYQLLGGLYRESVPLSWSLASGDIDEELDEAREMMSRGIGIFKLKVAALPPERDVERVLRIREALGPGVSLRIDANQGWDRSTAIRAIGRMAEAGLDFAEQPVPRWDMAGMSAIAGAVSVPLMADEGLCTPQDALALIRAEAAGVFGLKVTKMGGLLASKRVSHLAEAAGIPCYAGCMIETSLGTAAYLHLACSAPQVTLGCELFGPLLINGDIATQPTRYQGGHVLAPEGPGLGVELDEGLVREFARK